MVLGPGNTSDILGFRGGGRLGAEAVSSRVYFEFISIGEITRAQTHFTLRRASFVLKTERGRGSCVFCRSSSDKKRYTSDTRLHQEHRRRKSRRAGSTLTPTKCQTRANFHVQLQILECFPWRRCAMRSGWASLMKWHTHQHKDLPTLAV